MGKKVFAVPGNGYCFLEAAREGIKSLTGNTLKVNDLIVMIMDEIKNRIDFYSNFQPNITNPNDLIQQASLFFDKRMYTIEAVDVCIAAASNALQMNMYICDVRVAFSYFSFRCV